MMRPLRATVVLAAAPWVLASVVTALFSLFGGVAAATASFATFFKMPIVLTPLVAFVECLAVILLLVRRKRFTGQHWTVGGVLALASTAAVAVVGLASGGGFGLLWLLAWSMYSGYWAIAWLTGAFVWRSLTAPESQQAATASRKVVQGSEAGHG